MIATDKNQTQLRTAAWLGAALNLLLTLAKGVVGILTGSRALTADAVHSAADLVGSAAVIVGLRIAKKPPDADHPYGHGKAELISSLIVALFLLGAGVEVGFEAVKSLFEPAIRPEVAAATTAAGAIVLKEIMYQYTYRLGTRLHSKSLVASAQDHRSDVFSSLAALIGIVLALIGQWRHIHWLLYMDPVAGAIVACLVLVLGYEVLEDSLRVLMDRAVEPANLAPYKECIEQVPGVEHIDELRVRDHGQYVIIDCEISVSASLTVADGHKVAADVRRQLRAVFRRVQDVFVHVNPYYPGDVGLGEDHHD